MVLLIKRQSEATCKYRPDSACFVSELWLHCGAALLQFSPAQGLVRLALAEDLNGKQHRLMADLAKTAAAKWEEEQHPGWTPAGVDSEPLLANLQSFQVSTACSVSCFLALHLPSLCRNRTLLDFSTAQTCRQ